MPHRTGTAPVPFDPRRRQGRPRNIRFNPFFRCLA